MNRQYISDFFFLHSAPFFFPQKSHNGHFINLDISWLLHKMLPVTQHLQGRQTSLGTYWTTWGFLIKPQVLMQRWLPQVEKHRSLVEPWLVKSTSTEPSLEHPEENKWQVGLLRKTLTPLKFQALGDGNMVKLFCRCRLGLEEDKKKERCTHYSEEITSFRWSFIRRRAACRNGTGRVKWLKFSTAQQSWAAKHTLDSFPGPQEESSKVTEKSQSLTFKNRKI